jgi:hypothetical protein
MKNKYSDGEDIITSDDDNPDDQEVYREFQSTGVKIRDTPPGKKAVGRNTPRSTALLLPENKRMPHLKHP